jgi:hypothetical protein
MMTISFKPCICDPITPGEMISDCSWGRRMRETEHPAYRIILLPAIVKSSEKVNELLFRKV